MLRKAIFLFAASGVLFTSSTAFAWDKLTTGKVLNVMMQGSGFYFQLVGTPDMCNVAATAAQRKNADIFPGSGTSMNADAAKMAHAAVVAALLSGKSVGVYADNNASGDCIVHHLQLLAQ